MSEKWKAKDKYIVAGIVTIGTLLIWADAMLTLIWMG